MKRLEITNILVLVLGAICKSGAELIELNKVTDVSSPQFYCQADFPSVNNYTPLENSKLIFVQTVFRHGDRTPTYIAPGDTTDWNICNYKNYINEAQDAAKSGLGTRIKAYTQYSSTKQLNYTGIFWKGNCQRGQLSVKGANQLETLGSELRKIYVDKLQFLDSELKDANIKVRHTYVSRTLASAESFIGGLYPPECGGDGRVDFVIVPQEIDSMFINTALCPRLSQIRSMMKSTTKYQTYFNSTYADFVRLNKILKYSPQTATNSSIAFVLAADVFLPIECNNKPKLCSDGTCVTDGDVALSSSNTQLEFQDLRHFSPYSQEFNRLTGGAMLSQLLDELSYQINYSANAKSSDEQSTRPVRMSVYSGHDETIAGILSIFKVKNLEAYLPPYASSIITEVWQNDLDKKYYLRIMYNGKTVALLPNSETQALWCDMNKCDWDTYRDYISKSVPTDLYQECKVKQ